MKTEEKEHALLFTVPWEEHPSLRSLSRTYLVFPNGKQLIVKPYICLPQRQTRHVCATVAGQTVSPGKPRRLPGTSVPEGGMNLQLSYRTVPKYKWFPGLEQFLLQVMSLVAFGLVKDISIIKIS